MIMFIKNLKGYNFIKLSADTGYTGSTETSEQVTETVDNETVEKTIEEDAEDIIKNKKSLENITEEDLENIDSEDNEQEIVKDEIINDKTAEDIVNDLKTEDIDKIKNELNIEKNEKSLESLKASLKGLEDDLDKYPTEVQKFIMDRMEEAENLKKENEELKEKALLEAKRVLIKNELKGLEIPEFVDTYLMTLEDDNIKKAISDYEKDINEKAKEMVIKLMKNKETPKTGSKIITKDAEPTFGFNNKSFSNFIKK